MCVRFTEYLKLGDREMNLYFMQGNVVPHSFLITIYAKGQGPLELILSNISGEKWSLSPPDTPEWAQLIKPNLEKIIEYRLTLMV